MKKRFWFEIDSDDYAIVASMLKNEFGIELNTLTSRTNKRFALPAGAGFGDKVWRVNYADDCIEASFSKPCFQSKTLKGFGFKWCHERGVWIGDNDERCATACRIIKLVQVEGVPKC